jgi:hydroxyacylglutathione hydrolase
MRCTTVTVSMLICLTVSACSDAAPAEDTSASPVADAAPAATMDVKTGADGQARSESDSIEETTPPDAAADVALDTSQDADAAASEDVVAPSVSDSEVELPQDTQTDTTAPSQRDSAADTSAPSDADTEPQAPAPYEPITVQSAWFNVSYLAPRTYILRETKSYEGNVSYLILGEERAIMCDTGSGENTPVNGTRIKHVIDQLTDLPVTLLLSHFHYDHTQNLSEFDHVAFIELPHLVAGTAPDGTYTFSQDELLVGTSPASVQVDEWWPVETDIDLGSRSIQVVSIPGHADESVMIVDEDNRLMFMGDYLYNGELFVFGEDNLPIYEVTVDLLIEDYDSSYALYGAHGYPKVPHSDLQGLKDLLGCIATGVCPPEPLVVWGWPAEYYSLGGMQLLLFL